MGLVVRSGRSYYYRPFRRNGRVTTEYIAAGIPADLLGLIQAERNARLAADRAARLAERERLTAEDKAIKADHRAVDLVVCQALAALGLHRRNRGPWRRRRMPVETRITSKGRTRLPAPAASVPAASAPSPMPRTLEEFDDLFDKIDLGDLEALPRVKALIRAGLGPDLGETVNPEWLLESTLIERTVGSKNLFLRETLSTQLAAMREELGGASPSPLERLLVNRVVFCWLVVYYYEKT